MTTAYAGYSTTLGYGTAGLSTATSNYTTMLAAITNIAGPGGDCTPIDISNMGSPNAFKEFIPGMVDAGDVAVDILYGQTQTAAIYALFRAPKGFQITFPDTHTFTFQGFLKGLGQSTPTDDKITQTVTFKVTGEPVFT